MKILNILIITLALASCNKEAKTEDNRPNYIKWEIILPQNNDLIQIWDPIITDDNILIPVKDQGILLCLNKLTGEEVWRWTEARDTYPGADGFGEKNYLHENILVTSHNNLTYGIDITTGKTVWHDRNIDNGATFVYGLYDNFIKVFRNPNEFSSIRVGNVNSGEMEEIYRFEREDSFAINTNIPMLFDFDNKLYATFNKIKALSNEEGFFQNSWVYLFNVTDNELVWSSDSIPKEYQLDVTAGLRPIYSQGKVMMCNRSIYAYNVDTGEIDWWDNTHSNTFAWSTYLTTADNKVFGNNENQYMVALDVDTGEELWRTTTGGTGSRIEYYDGKCYITEVTKSDGYSYFMVLDATTGEVLHNIASPYEVYGENNWYWDDKITVDQETGLIYTADHNKVICIELD